jgi:hypothetical protein
MTLRKELSRYSGFILVAPVIVPLFFGVTHLLGAGEAYSTWVRHDNPYTAIHQCRLQSDGIHLTRQGMDDFTTDGIPCACSSLACSSVAQIEQAYAQRFLQAGLFLFAGAVILFVFSKKRSALAARRLLPTT